MAKNIVFEKGEQLSVTPTAGGATSGAPGLFGDLPFVALTDVAAGGNPAGKVSAKFNGVAELSVKGVNAGGNSAVAVGDVLYYTDGDSPKINKKATGTRFGVAMATVGSGSTATIRVRIGY